MTTKSFDTFMSDVADGETRGDEMRAEWEKQNPGKPYPTPNGVGEQVGTPEQLDDKKKKAAVSPEVFEQKVAESHKQIETELAKPGRNDWPPAKGNEAAEKVATAKLEAGLNSVA